jgi:hypothetical protein
MVTTKIKVTPRRDVRFDFRVGFNMIVIGFSNLRFDPPVDSAAVGK